MARRGIAIVLLALLGGWRAEAELRVQPNKENVVASRLAGAWRRHPALTQRLRGLADPPRGETPGAPLTFRSEPAVAARVPERYHKFLAGKPIFMAGTLTLRGKDHPFLLIELHGNPHVVYFRERDGNPMGDAESFNLMLSPAKDRAKDLLFIGGDFNNQPFDAYERRPAEPAAAVPRAQPARVQPDTR